MKGLETSVTRGIRGREKRRLNRFKFTESLTFGTVRPLYRTGVSLLSGERFLFI